MIRVRVSSTFKVMKQDCIDYLITNKVYKITGNIIRLVIDSDGEMVLFMTRDTYVIWCKGKHIMMMLINVINIVVAKYQRKLQNNMNVKN